MLRRETLTKEHATIEALAAGLRHHAGQRPPDFDRLGRDRWQLSRLLLLHLAKEDRLLHPMLQRSGDPAVVAISHRFEAELGGLADAFRAYVVRWDAAGIAADPDGSRPIPCG